MEPTSVCVFPDGNRVLVADNGAECVFDCRPFPSDGQPATVTVLIGPQEGKPGSMQSQTPGKMVNNSKSLPNDGSDDALCRVTGICVTSKGEIILAAGSEIRVSLI